MRITRQNLVWSACYNIASLPRNPPTATRSTALHDGLACQVGRIGGYATAGALSGFLWGWLPCGLVYSMLLFAALSADATRGALLMVAFGLGTLPSMLASGVFAARINNA